MKLIKHGTSIIEVVIAATLISVAVIAALSLTSQSQKQNTYARSLAEATKYATQAADWIRNERNNLGFATVDTLAEGDYCLNTFPATITEMAAGNCDTNSYILATNFKREVTITKTADTINVVVRITWMDKVERQTKIEMELTSWH